MRAFLSIVFMFLLGFPGPALSMGGGFKPVASSAIAVSSETALPKGVSSYGSLDGIIFEVATRNHVPIELVHRIIHVESRGNCLADSGVAKGVMQVKPETARSVGVYGNLKNCAVGVEAGVRYLKLALNMTGGSWTEAATLYNRGIWARPSSSQYAMMVMH